MQRPSEILVDGFFGHSHANIYRVKINWTNDKPVLTLPPDDLSANHLSSDKDLTVQYPYIFYLNVFNDQVQSLTALNANNDERQIFSFAGTVKSASLLSIPRHRIDVRFLQSGYPEGDAIISVLNNKVVSNSQSLVLLSAANDQSAPFIRFVEAVKGYAGSGLVAFLENTWYGFQDTATRSLYYLTHGNSTNRAPDPSNAKTGAPLPPLEKNQHSAASARLPRQPVGPAAGGRSALEKIILHPDPERPYVDTYLIKINPRYVDFHLVAGTKDPASITGIHGSGEVPISSSIRKRVVAAFNGGFNSKDGHFGVMVDSKLYLPPKSGLATVAVYSDGRVALDSWEKIPQSPAMISFIQNLPLIIDNGRFDQNIDNQAAWGKTVGNSTRVWRSGLGITGNGEVIYAAGNYLSVRTLATALQAAGSRRAMELDINSYWTTFNFYQWVTGNGAGYLVGSKLIQDMHRPANRYLTPDNRAFFYLTLKKGA